MIVTSNMLKIPKAREPLASSNLVFLCLNSWVVAQLLEQAALLTHQTIVE